MEKKVITLAEEYYLALGEHNIEEIKARLHPEVTFCGPLAELQGAKAVADATKNFMDTITNLRIRGSFERENQAVVVYNVDIPGLATDFRGVSWLTFESGLVKRIELFYDASLFNEKKEVIFKES